MHEAKYKIDTSPEYRKEMGQFFTPAVVADLMTRWVVANDPKTILDPAFGLGIFYEQAHEYVVENNAKFVGYEIDDQILKYFDRARVSSELELKNEDYLESRNEKFDAIICNPPYMRFQKFLNRHNVLPIIEQRLGRKLVGYSNISSVFLVKALEELNLDGRLAFILPFEFFNTGYGKEIKRILLEGHLLKQIVIFANEKEIFPDATTTVCILLCSNDTIESPVKLTSISSQNELSDITDISKYYQHEIGEDELPYNKKWTPIISSLYEEQHIPDGLIQFMDYGSFKRGIATGANKYFALSESKIKELNLRKPNYCKCITKSAQIRKLIFIDDDFETLANLDKPVYCFDVKEPGNHAVLNYIRCGEELGFHKRYLTKNRRPWYRIEHREPSPILVGVFNRGRIKVIRNMTTAISFTCFHSFYPNMYGESYINKLFVYLLSDVGQKLVKINKRDYGSQLEKFEPGDLNESLCPSPEQLDLMEEIEAQNVIDVAKTDEQLAIQIANELIRRIISARQDIVPSVPKAAPRALDSTAVESRLAES